MFPFGNLKHFLEVIMTFPERLMFLQQSRNLDKKDVFSSCGISRVSYYRYESGERLPTLDVLIALADYFGVSIDYLVGRTDNPAVNR